MKIEKYTKTLDELSTDLIVATLFETERPPRGVTGLVDWRLNGFISRQILLGTVSGTKDETVLLPLNRRLPARRVLLFGLGTRKDFSLVSARHSAFRVAKMIKGLGAIDVAFYFPSAFDEREPGDTERAIIEVLRQADLKDDVIIKWLSPPADEPWPLIVPNSSNSLAFSRR